MDDFASCMDTGELEHDTLPELYSGADVFVFPSATATFGLSVLEAQASGLPVVGVRAGALPERVDAETGVLCRPDSPRDMARCIEEWNAAITVAGDRPPAVSQKHTIRGIVRLKR